MRLRELDEFSMIRRAFLRVDPLLFRWFSTSWVDPVALRWLRWLDWDCGGWGWELVPPLA